MERALYIPTNRHCVDAIGHGIAECAELRHLTGIDHLFVLVEHGQAVPSSAHRTAIERGVAGYDLPALHLTADDWTTLATAIVSAAGLAGPDAERAQALLNPLGVAYGAGPNKTFLLAASLGIEVLHRRDSDLVPDVIDGVPRYAGVLEARAIGRPLREVAGLTNAEAVPPQLWDRRVSFVGTSYVGDAPQDRRDVLAAGERFAVALQALTRPAGLDTPDLARQVQDYFVEEGRRHHAEDYLQFDADAGRIELGVSCVWQVFRELPEMPMPQTLGADYRQRNLLTQLDSPVLFQSRKMHHQYGADRRLDRPVAEAVEYSLRDLRMVLLWLASWRQRQLIRAEPSTYLLADGSLDAARHAAALRDALADTLPAIEAMPGQFADVYRQAAAATAGPLSARLAAIAQAAEGGSSRLVGDVVRGIDDYCWLAERWSELVAAAPAVAPEVHKLVLT